MYVCMLDMYSFCKLCCVLIIVSMCLLNGPMLTAVLVSENIL